MDSRAWVVNASPLILLGKSGCLDMLAQISGKVIVPIAVKNEIAVGEGGRQIIASLENDSRFVFSENEDVQSMFWPWDLGDGETQVLVQFLKYKAERAVLDDMEARRCAKAVGIPCIGTLGLVARAKRHNLIISARPIFDELLQHGLYASPALVSWILEQVGE